VVVKAHQPCGVADRRDRHQRPSAGPRCRRGSSSLGGNVASTVRWEGLEAARRSAACFSRMLWWPPSYKRRSPGLLASRSNSAAAGTEQPPWDSTRPPAGQLAQPCSVGSAGAGARDQSGPPRTAGRVVSRGREPAAERDEPALCLVAWLRHVRSKCDRRWLGAGSSLGSVAGSD